MKSSDIINQILCHCQASRTRRNSGNGILIACFKTIGKIKRATHCFRCLKLPESRVISAMDLGPSLFEIGQNWAFKFICKAGNPRFSSSRLLSHFMCNVHIHIWKLIMQLEIIIFKVQNMTFSITILYLFFVWNINPWLG